MIYVRQIAEMRTFYETTMGFALHRELSPRWIEFRIGANILALAARGGRFVMARCEHILALRKRITHDSKFTGWHVAGRV